MSSVSDAIRAPPRLSRNGVSHAFATVGLVTTTMRARQAPARAAGPLRAVSRHRYGSDSCARQARPECRASVRHEGRARSRSPRARVRTRMTRSRSDSITLCATSRYNGLAGVELGESGQWIGGVEQRAMPALSRALAQRRRLCVKIEDCSAARAASGSPPESRRRRPLRERSRCALRDTRASPLRDRETRPRPRFRRWSESSRRGALRARRPHRRTRGRVAARAFSRASIFPRREAPPERDCRAEVAPQHCKGIQLRETPAALVSRRDPPKL